MPDFVPTFWNTLTQHNVGSRTSRVSAGQVAYKKQGSAWDHVNNDILGDLSSTAFPGNVQFPTSAQGWADIHFNSEYSAKRQVVEGNWSSSEDEFVMRMRADAPTNATGIIHPDKPWQVIYYNAFGQGANLIYGLWHGRATRVEHVIEITEMPPGDSEFLTYDFFIESNDATAFVGADFDQRPWAGNTGDGATVEGFGVFLAKGDDHTTTRGSLLRTPVCWWANIDGTTTKKNVRIDFVIQPDGITVKATKYVRRTDIADALAQGSAYRADATFNPDANPETTSVDGHTHYQFSGSTKTFTEVVAGTATGVYPNDSTMWVLIKRTSIQVLRRAHILFDTSSIGAGQSVDSASLTFADNTADYGNAVEWRDELINVYSSAPATNTALVTGDHVNCGTTKFSTGKSQESFRAASNSVLNIEYVLNGDGESAIAMEGVSKFALRLECEADNTEPAAGYAASTDCPISLYSADNTGTTLDPLLTVTHSAAATGSPHYYYQNTQGAA
jgi:hypothetical protein